MAKYLADGKGQVFAVKSVDKMEIIKGDDIDVTMAERRILELGTKRNFLTQIHSSFQVKCQTSMELFPNVSLQTNERLFFVMEYLSGGDLMFHLMNAGKFSFRQAQVSRKIFIIPKIL